MASSPRGSLQDSGTGMLAGSLEVSVHGAQIDCDAPLVGVAEPAPGAGGPVGARALLLPRDGQHT